MALWPDEGNQSWHPGTVTTTSKEQKRVRSGTAHRVHVVVMEGREREVMPVRTPFWDGLVWLQTSCRIAAS